MLSCLRNNADRSYHVAFSVYFGRLPSVDKKSGTVTVWQAKDFALSYMYTRVLVLL